MEHPITPPPELVRQWRDKWLHDNDEGTDFSMFLATQAARWGDEQRLEANCEWLEKGPYGFTIAASAPHMISDLRAARRPKPPSLAEQGLKELDLVPTHDQDGRSIDADTSVIRRALERLQQLEQQENNDN